MARGGALEVVVAPVEDRPVADAGPLDLGAVLLQHQPAVVVVAAHHQVGLRAGDRTLVGAHAEAGRLADRPPESLRPRPAEVVALDGVGGQEGERHDRRQGAGHDALLDHHAVLHAGPVAQVDHARDARPDRILEQGIAARPARRRRRARRRCRRSRACRRCRRTSRRAATTSAAPRRASAAGSRSTRGCRPPARRRRRTRTGAPPCGSGRRPPPES